MQNIIVDLDGTLALEAHRRHYIASHGWEKYFEHIVDDIPNPAVLKMLQDLSKHGYNIFIFTSRPEQYREITSKWLAKFDMPPHFMEMRAVEHTNLLGGDWQAKLSDNDLKLAMLERHNLNWGNTLMVLEDRDEMVDFYRNLGFNCWQVHYQGKMFKGKV